MKKVLLWIVIVSLLLFLVGGCTAPSAPITSPTPTASYVSPSAPTAPSISTSPPPVAVGVWEGITILNEKVLCLTIDPSNPQTLYTGTDGTGVWKSSNGGASWSFIGLKNTPVIDLAIDPSNPQTLYAATGFGEASQSAFVSGMYKSSDGGASWANSSNGLTSSDVRRLVVDPSNPQTLYAGTGDGHVFKSMNSGTSWSASSSLSGDELAGLSCLAIDPSNSQVLYAGAVSLGIFSGGVIKSSNGGITWSNIGLTNSNVSCLAIDPSNPQTLYAGTFDEGVWKSSDSGASWAASISGLTTSGVSCLATDPSNPKTLFAGTDGGVFKSSNGGITWSNIGLTNSVVICLAIDSTGILFAGADGNVLFRLAP